MAGQRRGLKEADDGIWVVSCMNYDLGYIDLEQKTQSTTRSAHGCHPCLRYVLLPMCPGRTSGRSRLWGATCYAISRGVDARLALTALRAAVAGRQPPKGCIQHCDRGSQYAAEDHRAALGAHGLTCSVGRRSNPYAKAESFMKTFKVEEA